MTKSTLIDFAKPSDFSPDPLTDFLLIDLIYFISLFSLLGIRQGVLSEPLGGAETIPTYT